MVISLLPKLPRTLNKTPFNRYIAGMHMCVDRIHFYQKFKWILLSCIFRCFFCYIKFWYFILFLKRFNLFEREHVGRGTEGERGEEEETTWSRVHSEQSPYLGLRVGHLTTQVTEAPLIFYSWSHLPICLFSLLLVTVSSVLPSLIKHLIL